MASQETSIFRPVLVGSAIYTVLCIFGMYGAYRAGYAGHFAFDLSPFLTLLGGGIFGASCLVLLATTLLSPGEYDHPVLRSLLLVAGLTAAVGVPLVAFGGYMRALDYPTWTPFFWRGIYAVIGAGMLAIGAMTLRVTVYWDEEEPDAS